MFDFSIYFIVYFSIPYSFFFSLNRDWEEHLKMINGDSVNVKLKLWTKIEENESGTKSQSFF